MSTVESGSPELKKLQRRFKDGYSLEHTGGGHYRVRNGNGRFVKHGGKNITLSGTAHGGRALANMEAQLKAAGVLKDPQRSRSARDHLHTPEVRRARQDAIATRTRNRQVVADKLKKRMADAVARVGGIELPGMQADLAHIGSMFSRRTDKPITPDLLANSISRVASGGWVEQRFQDLWGSIAEELETSKDPIDKWFELVREARGLPGADIVVKRPVEGDWPFRVELLPLEALMVDHEYQRPVSWPFVRARAAQFDESLVGTIDCSERRRGAVFAILDGQTRFEMCRLVGKKTIWASIYSGLDVQSEARFFLHKNKDRKVVHPYYTLKARVTAGDPAAMEIWKIVERNGYKLAITAPKQSLPKNISAIAAVEQAYNMKRQDGTTALTPTLATLKRTTFGLDQGQNNVLIRGLSRVFAFNTDDEINQKALDKVLMQSLPSLYLARAREQSRHSGGNAEYALARLVVSDYNRAVGARGGKLRVQ